MLRCRSLRLLCLVPLVGTVGATLANPCPPACLGDLDGDCVVGIADLLALFGHWGSCP